jgi:hypothetical protein
MAKIIHCCMACGKVTFEVESDHYTNDVISHGGECESEACKSKMHRMTYGIIPCEKMPPLWCEIKRKE